MKFYTNNFRGRAGRKEQAKHLVAEFQAIEDAFVKLQQQVGVSYLTTYVYDLNLTGEITILPSNGLLQEVTITTTTTVTVAPPQNESQYRFSLLVHGPSLRVVNNWGAQTWKEYGQGNWYTLHTGQGPRASMLLDFWWDICSLTWICVTSSRNLPWSTETQMEERFYPLLCDLANTQGDDTLGFTRASHGMVYDSDGAYHYRDQDLPRHHGIRHHENWVPNSTDLTGTGWTATDCNVTTDAGAGPDGQDVSRLSFQEVRGNVATGLLPGFGRPNEEAAPIYVRVGFRARTVTETEGRLRVVLSWMGADDLDPRVHDADEIALTDEWAVYGVYLNVNRDSNQPLNLEDDYPRTFMQLAFMSPSGELGDDVQITDIYAEPLRERDAEDFDVFVGLLPEMSNTRTTLSASIALSASGDGTWDDGTKVLSLLEGERVNFGGNLSVGKTYLVVPELTLGAAPTVEMQNGLPVWSAGPDDSDTYLAPAPFTFQYDGGDLAFEQPVGLGPSQMTVNVYEVLGSRFVSCYEDRWSNIGGLNAPSDDEWDEYQQPVQSFLPQGVGREIASENLYSFAEFRDFNEWNDFGLSTVEDNECKRPIVQTEWGIDGRPARATLLQKGSKSIRGYLELTQPILANTDALDFSIFVRKPVALYGTVQDVLYTPEHDDVVVEASRYVDFEIVLSGGGDEIAPGRVRLDIFNSAIVAPELSPYDLRLDELGQDWLRINISLANDGTHTEHTARIFPAGGQSAEPDVVDDTLQGWVIVDWAQLEYGGGTFIGSSPMVGGESRAVEDFTTGLNDGFMYREYDTLGTDGRVAEVTGGDLIWDADDGIYRDLTYATIDYLLVPNARNMHEFGRVDADEPPPPAQLTILTTPLYPLESMDSLQFGADISYGNVYVYPQDSVEIGSVAILDGEMVQVLVDADLGSESTAIDTVEVLDGTMVQVLFSEDLGSESHAISQVSILDGTMEELLVTVDSPDEELQLSCDIDPANSFMTMV